MKVKGKSQTPCTQPPAPVHLSRRRLKHWAWLTFYMLYYLRHTHTHTQTCVHIFVGTLQV